ncbi:RNA polymerase sigma factor (sigma-70 family) [Virgibacillus halotolerans]|uniref:RNA polymerase sigma factor n=1 Tax=Virgibacillus halotolerans TaxID=1071053 RepID=UPI0019605C88|nr:sigma-70 family RNA polymerase sigma factor [Virgibacillus halotolerans]MBM7599038.1 RNA polymerase sigma factor (sigma-70 family) [Virgibacillus halotolerans]
MEKTGKITFEEIFKQNERRIHYYIHRMNVRDPHREFYQEGMVAMWNAYESYQPDKGPLSTYFNYMIRNRMIDLMRKHTRVQEKEALCIQAHRTVLDEGHTYSKGQASYPLLKGSEVILKDSEFWGKIRAQLSTNQWKWVQHSIIEGMKLKEIATQEGVSVDAVKSWGREARRKLRDRVEEERLHL